MSRVKKLRSFIEILKYELGEGNTLNDLLISVKIKEYELEILRIEIDDILIEVMK
jgi:hypothetical protein